MNKRIREITKQLESALNLVTNLRSDLKNAYSDSFMQCMNCGKKSKIGRSILVEREWYDSNTGSPCGGYYRHGGYYFGCPKCFNFSKNEIDKKTAYEIMGSFSRELKMKEGKQFFNPEE